MLITESLSSEARARARKLGVRKVAFKSALTKLDDDEYASDLESFTRIPVHELHQLVAGPDKSADEPSVAELSDDVLFDFLKTMTEQLKNPNQSSLRSCSVWAPNIASVRFYSASKVLERMLSRPSSKAARSKQLPKL